MSRLGKIARRTFLVGSAAIAGGVAFGVYKVTRPIKNPLLDDLPEGEAALNPWVKISEDGITLITPHIDIGQGAKSMQTMLMCEELDADLDQVSTDQGQPAQAYWNSALVPEMATFMAGRDDGFVYNTVDTLATAGMRTMGFQITGGSSSTPNSFDRLRQAGASARETLKATAARQTGVDVSELSTAHGAVILPDGREIPYTDLAADAANEPVVQNVALRDPSEWRYIGKPVQRIDIPAKSTGAPIFGIDTEVDGMVYASCRRNPYKNGGMTSFDASEALSMPGVIDVVEITNGYAVVANNTWRAMQALDAVVPEWENGAYPPNQDAHWEILSESFTGDDYNSRKTDEGDIETALSDGESINAEYRGPYMAHATLEPLNATVVINDDSAEVWIGSQAPANSRSAVAQVAGLDESQVHMNITYAGGGFGIRSTTHVETIAAEIAVKMKGTPVKLTYMREEDFAQTPNRQLALARMSGVADGDGIKALDLSITMPNVTVQDASNSVPNPDAVAGAWAEPFDIPNRRVTGYAAQGLPPTTFWRSVGASTNGFFYNTAFDELAHQGGLDPLEERLRLCNDDVARTVLETVADMSNWSGRNNGAGPGRGLAFTYSFGVHTAIVVDVTQTDRGIRLDNAFIALDVGTIVDPVNFENQVQGGVVWGLGHAMNCEITFTDGRVDQMNYYDYEAMRMYQCPTIMVKGLENSDHVHGVGEPPVPPAPPALANAIFAATGQRIREMPFNKFVDFV